jgi:hypothetical protein
VSYESTMSYDSTTNERARRALSHGKGIDGILFMLMAGTVILIVVGLLIFGLSTAESNAERDAEIGPSASMTDKSELGTN